jgi:hypothetical protein
LRRTVGPISPVKEREPRSPPSDFYEERRRREEVCIVRKESTDKPSERDSK